jgi:hypothetical protein
MSKQAPAAAKPTALTAEAIFHAPDLAPLEPVEVPEWGGVVYVGRITVSEQERLWALNARDAKSENGCPGLAQARYVCIVARDEKGNRIFSDPLVDDTHARILAGKADVAVARVHDAAKRLNGEGIVGERDLKKNSGETLASDSSSS